MQNNKPYSIRKVGGGFGFFVNDRLIHKSRTIQQLNDFITGWILANQSDFLDS